MNIRDRTHPTASGVVVQNKLVIAMMAMRFEICYAKQTHELEFGRASFKGVRRDTTALSSGCKSHPANAPTGSNRSSYGGDEIAEAFG
jgi:hypothetical protein